MSLAAWGSGALAGLLGGLIRIWLPLLFLLAALGFAGALADPVGSWVFFFVESEERQELGGFFLISAIVLVVGIVVILPVWGLLSAVSPVVSAAPWVSRLNRMGGVVLGVLLGLFLLSVVLIGLQQYPVKAVGKGIAESTFASAPIDWVDGYVASLEISPEWEGRD